MMPWSFPCQLSESINLEISKALAEVKQQEWCTPESIDHMNLNNRQLARENYIFNKDELQVAFNKGRLLTILKIIVNYI
jgi:hypothetical protein